MRLRVGEWNVSREHPLFGALRETHQLKPILLSTGFEHILEWHFYHDTLGPD